MAHLLVPLYQCYIMPAVACRCEHPICIKTIAVITTVGEGLAGVVCHGRCVTFCTHCIHRDYYCSVVLARNGAATINSYAYSAFGSLTSAGGADVSRFEFSSKERDPSTGFSYYGYRFYSPQWQRWISRDPIGERGGYNLYSFVGNNGVSNFDVHGLFLFRWDWGEVTDEGYIWENGKRYNARCLAAAAERAMECLKAVGGGGARSILVCVLGCVPTLVYGPVAYGVCVTGCFGLDAALSVYGIGSCFDEYSKLKEACRPCSDYGKR